MYTYYSQLYIITSQYGKLHYSAKGEKWDAALRYFGAFSEKQTRFLDMAETFSPPSPVPINLTGMSKNRSGSD